MLHALSVAIILASIVLLVTFYRACEHFSSDTKSRIPKIVWTYWHEEPMPDVVRLCIETMRKKNPDYTVKVLNAKDAENLGVTELKHAKGWPVRISDFVRIEALRRHGGIWIDSSTIVTRSLDWVGQAQEESGCEVVGFYLDGFTSNARWPVIENWFIAAVPGSPFIEAWAREFHRINEFDTVSDYLRSVQDSGVTLQAIDAPEYLVMHVAAQVVMQKEYVTKKSPWSLGRAEDGPFKYLALAKWDVGKELQAICDSVHKTDVVQPAIIKLRGAERHFMEQDEELHQCIQLFIRTLA